MSLKLLNLAGVLAITALAACSQPEPQRLTISPVYDKIGNVVACVGSDGQDYPVPQVGAAPVDGQRQNPCDPRDECRDPLYNTATGQYVCPPPGEDCENGYFDQTGQLICRPGDDGGDDQPQGRPNPQTPGATAGLQ